MSLAVIDASVLAVFYAADDPRHTLVVERLKMGATLFAPAHLDAEIVSALGGMAGSNQEPEQVVPRALTHLAGFPIRRMPLPPLLDRMWELRHTITAYDAANVALAERLEAVLVTLQSQARHCERNPLHLRPDHLRSGPANRPREHALRACKHRDGGRCRVRRELVRSRRCDT